jgi:hypothetical protein
MTFDPCYPLPVKYLWVSSNGVGNAGRLKDQFRASTILIVGRRTATCGE